MLNTTVVTSTFRHVPNTAAKTPITCWTILTYCVAQGGIRSGRPAGGSKYETIDTLDSARPLGENTRKEETVARMGHGVWWGTPHTVGMRLCKCECCVTWYGKRTTKT